jgi:hypothetical protein
MTAETRSGYAFTRTAGSQKGNACLSLRRAVEKWEA